MKQYFIAGLCAIFLYLLFYHQLLNTNIFIGGSDPLKFFYPSRYHLYQSMFKGNFPFWTEKIFSGYPIYADIERGFLNPINILSILLFGPFVSYKILHFLFYFVGCVFWYLFLQKFKQSNILSFMSSVVVLNFSLFTLYHQQHFGLTLITLLFPVFLYYVHMYSNSYHTRYVIILAFLTSLIFYIGNIQAVILILIPLCLYLFLNTTKIKDVFLYFLLTFALISPQFFPTIELYKLSARSSNESLFTQGSFMPFSMVNILYPYLFGISENYKWNMVNEEFFIHETYIYVGIVSFVLGFLGFTKITNNKKRKFIYGLAIIFILLSTWGYIPVINKISIPVFSMFRYWGRSVFLLNIALALSVVEFFNSKEKINLKKLLKPLSFLVVYLLFLQLVNFSNPSVWIPFKLLISGAFKINQDFFVWVALFSSTILISFLSEKLKPMLALLLILDLFIFGKPIINSYLRSMSDLQLTHQTYTTNARQIGFDKSYFWNLNLYSDNMGVLGYSQFIPKNYLNTLLNVGIYDSETVDNSLTDKSLELLGVGYLDTSFKGKLQSNILNSNFARNIIVNDGEISFDISTDIFLELKTLIRNYPGWQLKINNIEQNLTNSKDNTYLSFVVPQGLNHIQLRFIPHSFYFGIAILICLIIVLIVVYSHHAIKKYE